MKKLLFIVVLFSMVFGLDKLGTVLYPKSPYTTEEAEAKTYYDYNSNGFKSVNESTGQTFDYNTGNYGRDWSRGN